MTPVWTERQWPLRFMLGEVTLFTMKVPVMRLEAHFTNLGDDPDLLAGRLEDLPRAIRGLYIRRTRSSTTIRLFQGLQAPSGMCRCSTITTSST